MNTDPSGNPTDGPEIPFKAATADRGPRNASVAPHSLSVEVGNGAMQQEARDALLKLARVVIAMRLPNILPEWSQDIAEASETLAGILVRAKILPPPAENHVI